MIKALELVVNAAPLDVKFSTKVHAVLDGKDPDPILFTMAPMTGELIDDEDGTYRMFNIDFALSQIMDEETDENERNDSLSMLHANADLIYYKFKERHIIDSTTVNGEDLSCTLETQPTKLTLWNIGEDNRNVVQLRFSIKDDLPINCTATANLFTF